MTEARSITVGSHTPWGIADHVTIFSNGVVSVATSSHGGFYVPPHLNSQIAECIRAATWERLGEAGWYEEDCDWSIVATRFPDVINERHDIGEHGRQELRRMAGASFRRWIERNLSETDRKFTDWLVIDT